MQVRLSINGVEITPWLSEGGYVLAPLLRQSRSIITLGGTEYRTEVVKHSLSVTLVELRDTTLQTIRSAISSPATVLFTDEEGRELTRTMYSSGLKAAAKTMRGGHTYFSGVSMTLEER